MSKQEKKATSPTIVRILESRSTRVFYGVIIGLFSTAALSPSFFHLFDSLFLFLACAVFPITCYTGYIILTQAQHCARRVPNRAPQILVFSIGVYILGILLPAILAAFCLGSKLILVARMAPLAIIYALSFRYAADLLYKKIFDDPVGFRFDRDETSNQSTIENPPATLKLLNNVAFRGVISFLIAGAVIYFGVATILKTWNPAFLLGRKFISPIALLTFACFFSITNNVLPCARRKPQNIGAICAFFCFYASAQLLLFALALVIIFKYFLTQPPTIQTLAIYPVSILFACVLIWFSLRSFFDKLYKNIINDPIGFKNVRKENRFL